MVNESDGRRFSMRITPRALQLAVLLAVGAVVSFVFALNTIGVYYDGAVASAARLDDWESKLQEQRMALNNLRSESYYEFEGVVMRVEELHDGLRAIESFGQRMYEATGIAFEDFDMRHSKIGGIGGPAPTGGEIPSIDTEQIKETLGSLEGMDEFLAMRERQLVVLRSLLLSAGEERVEDKVIGKPVASGWISSGYGRRIDPITKMPAMHSGIDFGARYDADIVATGVGVVTFVGRDRAYGNYVEVAHGRGVATLYAHAGSISVSPGDVVEKGQVIGKVGDTGRTTGPHVHYEVIQDGKRLNPWKFVQSS